jgi:hypothetical protein
VAAFMDLVHNFILLSVKEPGQAAQLETQLIGPLGAGALSRTSDTGGITPPSWWKGDEYASRSSLLAMTTMRR